MFLQNNKLLYSGDFIKFLKLWKIENISICTLIFFILHILEFQNLGNNFNFFKKLGFLIIKNNFDAIVERSFNSN